MRHETTTGRSIAIAVWLTLVVTLAASSAHAQQPAAAFPALATALHEGDSVVVRDQAGKTVRGTVAGVSASALRVQVDGVVREWTAPDLLEVHRRGDSLRNGMLWGLALGGGGAAILGGLTFTLCANEVGQHCPRAKALSILLPLAGGVGAGLAVDAARTGETLLYQRSAVTVAPAVAPRVYGVTAAWRF